MKLKDIFDCSIQDIIGPFIYRITNIKTNKSYIGQTKTSLLQRFVWSGRSHKLRAATEQSKLYSDIRTDISSFEVHIVRFCNEEDLDGYEVESIESFNSLTNGYNRTIGGKSVSKEASELAHSRGYLGAKAKNKGCFYNKELRHNCSVSGGFKSAEVRILDILKTLSERSLDLNEENYMNVKREIGFRVSPTYQTFKTKYEYLLNQVTLND